MLILFLSSLLYICIFLFINFYSVHIILEIFINTFAKLFLMKLIVKNLGVMMFVLMGVIFFYLKNQGLVGSVLLKNVIIYTIQSVAVSIMGILLITFFWNRFIAVEEDVV